MKRLSALCGLAIYETWICSHRALFLYYKAAIGATIRVQAHGTSVEYAIPVSIQLYLELVELCVCVFIY